MMIERTRCRHLFCQFNRTCYFDFITKKKKKERVFEEEKSINERDKFTFNIFLDNGKSRGKPLKPLKTPKINDIVYFK